MAKSHWIYSSRAMYCLGCIICLLTVVFYIFINFENPAAFAREFRGLSKGISLGEDKRGNDPDPAYPRHICNCKKHEVIQLQVDPLLNGLVSSCSKEATELGRGQKVITLSLFTPGDSNSTFFFLADIDLLLGEIESLFPGWVVRIYSNLTLGPGNDACNLVCKKDYIYWCDITDIPGHGNMSSLDPRSWRFLVLDDPSVDIFISRDFDYQFTRREREAVAEWEASNLPFHTMRDHPFHTVGMLGGMWGAKNYLLPPDLRRNISQSIISDAKEHAYKGWDQKIIDRHIYSPYGRSLVLGHDSYYCDDSSEFKTLPYSVQRQGGEMIGFRNLGNASTIKICPVKCRPEHGKDWERC